MADQRVAKDDGAEAARELAGAALLFLAGDDERLGRFLALTGVDPSAIRRAAADDAFLAAVLDHILGDESLALAFAANEGVKPTSIMRAAHRLGGGPFERDYA